MALKRKKAKAGKNKNYLRWLHGNSPSARRARGLSSVKGSRKKKSRPAMKRTAAVKSAPTKKNNTVMIAFRGKQGTDLGVCYCACGRGGGSVHLPHGDEE